MGRVTAPEPHIPPQTRRQARAERERVLERAPEPPTTTRPLPVLDDPGPQRRSRRPSTGRTPTRVGARAVPVAPTRREARAVAVLQGHRAITAPQHAGHRSARVGIAALAVATSLMLVSAASVTAAFGGPELFTPQQAGEADAPEVTARLSAPVPATAETIPAPTVSAAPAALDVCSRPGVADALAAGDDAAAIAAAGGPEAFRAAVAGGTAGCVRLDDSARVWVVLNKTRPHNPLDYRPASLELPGGVRSIEGGALRADAAAALSAMASGAAAAGVGEIALLSGFRSFQTQQETYGNQVGAQGAAQADLTSARPGYSEHQSGLAADVVACADGCGTLDDLAATAQGQWIAANAWQYGWIVRYEAGYQPITGYDPEPWHLRFIGTDLAKAYHDGGWHTLEEFFGLPAAPTYP